MWQFCQKFTKREIYSNIAQNHFHSSQFDLWRSSKVEGHPVQIVWGQLKDHIHVYDFLYVLHVKFGHNMPHSEDTAHSKLNKAIRDGRPRPPRHQVGWDIVRRECACQISWWSVEKWRRYYILKFHGNTFRWPTTLTFDLKFWKYLSVTEYPYSMCMLSFMMIGWEMTEILHFEILRKHGQTNTQTNRHGHYNTSPSPYGGRGNYNLFDL